MAWCAARCLDDLGARISQARAHKTRSCGEAAAQIEDDHEEVEAGDPTCRGAEGILFFSLLPDGVCPWCEPV